MPSAAPWTTSPTAPCPSGEKRRFLDEWRGELTAPDCALSRELAWARREFAIPLAECEAMVAGMETDAGDRVRLPDGRRSTSIAAASPAASAR
jgi:hypothetical protein